MKETLKTYDKKVIALAAALMIWPIILIVFAILPIYSLVGITVDGNAQNESNIDATLATAETAARFLYFGPVSFIGAMVLLVLKGKK